MDPFAFVDESDGNTAPNFSDSFIKIFGEDSDSGEEEERHGFLGFQERDVQLGARVEGFHTREKNFKEKENYSQTNRPRKRLAKPQSWKKNVRKALKASGQAYRDYKGYLVHERETGPGCGCNRKCMEKLPNGSKLSILKRFNSMASTNLQNMYLRGLINIKEIKRVGSQGRGGLCHEENPSLRRTSNYEYFVLDEKSARHQVCQVAFQSLHGITYRRVRTIRAREVPIDRRGKSQNSRSNKLKETTINKIKEHVKSFPTEISHYARKDAPEKKYLNGDLSIQRMYHLYIEKEETEVWKRQQERTKAKQQNAELPLELKPEVSETSYRRIFNTQFNLGFGRPRTDTCSKCDELKLAGETRLLEEHHLKAEQGYASKRADKQESIKTWAVLTRVISRDIVHCSVDAVDMITYDFQQNLPTPTLTHNDMFYQRQLWTYNFGIHDCVAEQGHMFLWDESVAARGSSEVASCLAHYFEKNKSGAKSLISYSDGCGGQNKNIVIVGLYDELVKKGVYRSIDHKFLTRGHTFLPNDGDFAQIEKRKKTAVVHVPNDWAKVIEEANKKKPFQVHAMKQKYFQNYKEVIQEVYKHRKKTVDDIDVKFKEVHWLNFGWGAEPDDKGEPKMIHHPNEVWMRYGYSKDEPWKKVRLWNGKRPRRPEPMYNGQVRIKEAKDADLKKMAEKHLPPEKREFYMNLNTGRVVDAYDTDDDEWE